MRILDLCTCQKLGMFYVSFMIVSKHVKIKLVEDEAVGL